MPHMALLVGAGFCAGLYAGWRWVSGELRRQAAHAGRRNAEVQGHAAYGARAARDLGKLEWDEAAGVYRPNARA